MRQGVQLLYRYPRRILKLSALRGNFLCFVACSVLQATITFISAIESGMSIEVHTRTFNSKFLV